MRRIRRRCIYLILFVSLGLASACFVAEDSDSIVGESTDTLTGSFTTSLSQSSTISSELSTSVSNTATTDTSQATDAACLLGDIASEKRDCGNCGEEERSRICFETNRWGEWSDWGGCANEGVCTPDAVEDDTPVDCEGCGGQKIRSRTCTQICEWGPWGEFGNCTGGQGVLVPGGSFTDEELEDTHDIPAVCMDETEVTVAAYRVCVEAGICTIPEIDTDSNYDKAGRDQHPINNIDWPQAKTYCEFVGRRLPSEWEWEWAARGRDEGRAYPWGDAPEPSCEHVVMDVGGFGCGENRSWPVGSKPLGQSRDGILDMAGNIWEWTADWYDNSQMARTVRGGCFSNKEISWLRTGHRSNDAPSSRYTSNGVRCVKTLNENL